MSLKAWRLLHKIADYQILINKQLIKTHDNQKVIQLVRSFDVLQKRRDKIEAYLSDSISTDSKDEGYK
jgi:hypothetical protein